MGIVKKGLYMKYEDSNPKILAAKHQKDKSGLLPIQEIEQLTKDAYEEWREMPEYIQQKMPPKFQVLVHFSSYEDLQEFAKLIGQKLTKKTKSIWHPRRARGTYSDKRWK
jgi:ribosome biogenesis GTPase A